MKKDNLVQIPNYQFQGSLFPFWHDWVFGFRLLTVDHDMMPIGKQSYV